jgi:hypothetical protein
MTEELDQELVELGRNVLREILGGEPTMDLLLYRYAQDMQKRQRTRPVLVWDKDAKQ